MSFIDLLRADTSPAAEAIEGLLIHADGHLSRYAAWLEDQWALFEPLAEQGFIKKFRRNPHQFWWEMYLGSELRRIGFDPARSDAPNGEGPDFVLTHDRGKICIECVCPGRGDESNPERVPPIAYGEARYSPDEEMTLRIRRSIVEDKALTFRRYLSDGIISPDSQNIVAVSCSQLDYPGLPVMVGSVLPVGPLTLFLDENRDVVDVRHVRKSEIVRQSGSIRSTTGFEDRTLSHIAGVIFYTGTLFNTSSPAGELYLLQNPTAHYPLQSGLLPFQEL